MLPACVRDQFVQATRAAQPWAQHFHPTAPRTAPAISRGLLGARNPRGAVVGTGAQSPMPGRQGGQGIAHCCCGCRQRWALCLEQPLERCQIGPPLGDLLVLVFFFHFAGQAAEQNTWLRESKDGAGVPSGTSMQHTQWQWGTKERTAGMQKKGGGKKKKKKKDINSLGNTRPQGRETVRGTTAHVTGDRQTDSPVPIRYVKYHHSGTLTDL